jgi:hypothetical protein
MTNDVGEQLGWNQLVTVVGEEGVHRPVGDQVAAPGRRVQLVIGGVACGRHAGQSAPLAAHNANYRIDTASTID